MRSLEELLDVPSPAWPALSAAVDERRVDAEVLPVDDGRGERTLVALQVSVGSSLGALALHCGGLLVEHGWFRFLGGGSPHLPDLASVNGLGSERPGQPPWLVVGYDALGGVFAIDGGGLGVEPGEACYRGPDTLRFDGLGLGHGGLLEVALAGRLGDSFAALRWPGWEEEVSALRPDEGLSLYPPPYTVEGRDPATVSRRAVPLTELLAVYEDAARQLG